jgi:hypothetical protein
MPRRNHPKNHKPAKKDPYKSGSGCSNKVRYGSRDQAEAVKSDQENMNPDIKLKVYKCLDCGGWHLTRRTDKI